MASLMVLAAVSCDKESKKKAFDLLCSAAKSGDARAYYLLAEMYKEGECCEANDKMYRKYMRMAAECGDRDAKELVFKWNDRIRRRKK